MVEKRNGSSHTDEGFTLVELLVVIAILGILAAVAVFAIGGTTAKSKKAACQSDVAAVQVASDAFTAQSLTSAAATSTAQLVTAGYLRTAPATAMTFTAGSVAATTAC